MGIRHTTEGMTLQRLRWCTGIAIILWITVLLLSLAWNIQSQKRQTLALAQKEAVASMERDIAVRNWLAKRGGIYIHADKGIAPNEFLQHPQRDLAVNGIALTMVNPAYFLRTLMEDPILQSSVRSRIVSTTPIRPENTADSWESYALEQFHRGEPVAFQLVREEGGRHLRGMQPLITSDSCMNCHTEQAFEPGNVGGGISIILDMAPFLAAQNRNISLIALSHVILGSLGLLGITFMYRHSASGLRQVEHAITALRNNEEQLEKRVEDETRQRRKNEELLVHQSRMATMGKMIAVIGHQWKQPLNVLAILVQDLPEAFRHGEVNQQYLDTAATQAMEQIDFMASTIDDFRNFFDPGKQMETFSVNGAISLALKLIQAQLTHNNIQANLDSQCECSARGHKNEFQQVILNVLVNARDAIYERRCQNPDHHGLAGIIDIRISCDDGTASVQICDNGPGIAADITERIFDPYFSTKPGEGSGIGLWMAKSIMEESMGGSIRLEPDRQEGACFTLCFPVV